MADKSYKKLPASEVQGLLQLRRRGSVIKAKKGKGSYVRHPKHRYAAVAKVDKAPVF